MIFLPSRAESGQVEWRGAMKGRAPGVWLLVLLVLLRVAGGAEAAEPGAWIALRDDTAPAARAILEKEIRGFTIAEETEKGVRDAQGEAERLRRDCAAGLERVDEALKQKKERYDTAAREYEAGARAHDEAAKAVQATSKEIENRESEVRRAEEEIRAQKGALVSWLATAKQDEVLAAAVFRQGIDTPLREAVAQCDACAGPLLAERLGVTVHSVSRYVQGLLDADSLTIQASGTFKAATGYGTGDPLLLKADKGGNTYLRLQVYELYPWQKPETPAGGGGTGAKVRLVDELGQLRPLCAEATGKACPPELEKKVEGLLEKVAEANRKAREKLQEATQRHGERIRSAQEAIRSAREKIALERTNLAKLEAQRAEHAKRRDSAAAIRDRSAAERERLQAELDQLRLRAEAVVVKHFPVLASAGKSPKEGIIESIVHELERVRGEASASSLELLARYEKGLLQEDKETRGRTTAAIRKLKLLGFVNEGQTQRVSVAFWVETRLAPSKAGEAEGAGPWPIADAWVWGSGAAAAGLGLAGVALYGVARRRKARAAKVEADGIRARNALHDLRADAIEEQRRRAEDPAQPAAARVGARTLDEIFSGSEAERRRKFLEELEAYRIKPLISGRELPRDEVAGSPSDDEGHDAEDQPEEPAGPRVRPPDETSAAPLGEGQVGSQGKTGRPARGEPFTDPVTGMELVFVKGGTFLMGDVWGDGGDNEKPMHRVTVSDFYLGKYPVTQAQWEAVTGWNPSEFQGADRPVENVTWAECQEFIEKLNEKTGRTYRLPTEPEWEYAARSGGKREKWAGTSNESELEDYAWYDKNSRGQTHPVGQKKPNGLGLYDMSGNVWEWCQDWYGAYPSGAQRDPQGASSGSDRVVRGGSWIIVAWYVRSALRYGHDPGYRYSYLGFRVATVP